MKRFSVLAVVGAFVVALLLTPTAVASTSGGSTASGPEIKIGSIMNLSGNPYTAAGQGLKSALNAWAKWTNAHGGIAGHKVSLTVLDDKTDPAQSSVALKELVEQDGVSALVGVFAPPTEMGWTDYLQQHKVPVVGGANVTPAWFTSPMFYPAGTTVSSNVWGIVYSTKLAKADKVAGLWCAEEANCTGAIPYLKQDAKEQGVDLVYNATAPANAASYTPQCLAMKEAGATAVITIGINNDSLLRDCKRQNYKPKMVITNYQATLKQIKSDPLYNGSVGNVGTLSPYTPYAPTKDMFAAFKKYAPSYAPGGSGYGGPAQGSLVGAWAAGQAFKKAVENSGVGPNDPVTSADIIRGLSKFKDETLGKLTPPLTFSDGTQPNPQVKCFYLYKIEKGKYVDILGRDKLPKLACQP